MPWITARGSCDVVGVRAYHRERAPIREAGRLPGSG